jgi:glycerol-3-phosphate dehydrogenase
VYDLLAGSQALSSSYFMSKASTLEAFPMLKKDSIKVFGVNAGKSD